MAALAFTLGMLWTCITIKERKIEKQTVEENKEEKVNKKSFFHDLKEFFALSPEVSKICLMQFFTWIGTMCMMIFFTQYCVHTIFEVPDIVAKGTADGAFASATLDGTNFSSVCFAIFNLVCFLVAIPIGIFSAKVGNKKVHIFSILTMIFAYMVMAFSHNKVVVAMMMGISGIGWASICALPFAMLSQYIKKGTEGSVMGIFNIFIAGPQVVVCTVVAWIINHNFIDKTLGTYYHWEYTFIIGAMMLALAVLTTSCIKEKNVN